ncbi:NUDIX hydrolase [Salininema proteolyticum]|uniref:NUDIX hydrolase n=1 Tax=Salininema proteolyticum TaxID=1607685 RepID=A0ABV8U5I7_9ACTN
MEPGPIPRPCSRVLLIDREHRTLLLHSSEYYGPGIEYFLVPGGAAEPGESPVETAVREVFEETGLRTTPERLGDPVARTAGAWHNRSDGRRYRNDEHFYALRVDRFEPDFGGMEQAEDGESTGWAWMSADRLREADAGTYPVGVSAVVEHVLRGGRGALRVPWTDFDETAVRCPLPPEGRHRTDGGFRLRR